MTVAKLSTDAHTNAKAALDDAIRRRNNGEKHELWHMVFVSGRDKVTEVNLSDGVIKKADASVFGYQMALAAMSDDAIRGIAVHTVH